MVLRIDRQQIFIEVLLEIILLLLHTIISTSDLKNITTAIKKLVAQMLILARLTILQSDGTTLMV